MIDTIRRIGVATTGCVAVPFVCGYYLGLLALCGTVRVLGGLKQGQREFILMGDPDGREKYKECRNLSRMVGYSALDLYRVIREEPPTHETYARLFGACKTARRLNLALETVYTLDKEE